MRSVPSTYRACRTALAVPAVLAGTLALALGGPAANAQPAERSGERMPRPQAAERAASPALPALRATPLPGAAFRAVPAQAAPDTYVVQGGDSVSSIAAAHGLRTADVLALNGLSWSDSVIVPGQVLRLVGDPGGAGAPAGSEPTSTAPVAASAASGTHTVTAGDTISSIAAANGVTVQALFAANGLDWSSIIYPGQTVVIPGAAAPAAAGPAESSPPSPAAPSAGTHAVTAGDTISSIAAANGVTVQALFAANGLDWSSIIYPGQSIVVPGADMVLAASPTPIVAGLDAEQAANARLIVAIGRELGVPERGIAIALGTAMQESWIRNLDWGDRDSLGLFQQRPSTGWGTASEVRDPDRAIRAFYGGPSDPNGWSTRGLLDIPGWESMTYADAAQAVQLSAYPDRYAQWEQPALAWLAALG